MSQCNGKPPGEGICGTPANRQGRQRGDQWVDAKDGHYVPVPDPHRQPDENGHENGFGHAHSIIGQFREHDGRERCDTANREIECTGNDNERLADRDHANYGGRGDDDLEVAGRVKLWYQDCDDGERHAVGRDQCRYRRHADFPAGLPRRRKFRGTFVQCVHLRPQESSRIAAWDTCEPSNSPITCPSRRTTTRSGRLAASPTSVVATTTAVPAVASCRRLLWICCREGRSTPRVGSDSTSILGAAISRLATRTFCWFPPLSSETRWSGLRHRIRQLLICWSTNARSAERRRTICPLGFIRVRFSCNDRVGTMPWRPRSAGT